MRILIAASVVVLLFIAACGGSNKSTSSPTAALPAPQTESRIATSTPRPAQTALPTPVVQAVATAEATRAIAATQAPVATQAVAPTQPPPPTQAVAPTQPPPTQAAVAPSAPVTLSVTAHNISFDKQTITVPAHTRVTVNFQNTDASVTHDFGVSLPGVAHTQTCAGPCMASITFDSGAAGTYSFQCSIHSTMVGVFIVQ